MAIKSLIKIGNQKLATPSLPIMNFYTEKLKNIIIDMQDTMQKENGVGSAAPQIGYNFRIIIFGFEKNNRYPDAKPVPFTVLINPTIEIISSEIENDWDGC